MDQRPPLRDPRCRQPLRGGRAGDRARERGLGRAAHRRIGARLPPQGVTPGTLTLHADRGRSMRSQPVALRLADLGGAKTPTRPYPASDTPYAEAPCKTLEYRPGCPRRCGSLEDARACCQAFCRWSTHAHRQAGRGLLTPAAVPAGRAPPLRPPASHAAHPAHRRLDQSTETARQGTRDRTVTSTIPCLTIVDRFHCA